MYGIVHAWRLEKCELCSKKASDWLKSKAMLWGFFAAWHFQAVGQVVRPLWWLGTLFKVNSVFSAQIV